MMLEKVQYILQHKRRIVVSLLIVSLLIYTYPTVQLYLPCMTLPVPANDPRSQPILAALNQGYATLDQAYVTHDVDLLAIAFIDHPVYRWKLSQSERASLRAFITRVSGAAVAQDFGYLTAMQNKLRYRIHGDQLLRAKLAEGFQEISELSETEWTALAAQNWGERPTLLGDVQALPQATSKRVVGEIDIVHLCADKAELNYSTGVKGYGALLLWRDGKWWIAGIF